MKIVPQGSSSSLTDFQYNFLGKLLKPACSAYNYSQFTSAYYGTFQINPVNSWYVFPTEDCSINPYIKTMSGFSRWDYGKIKIAENVATVNVPDNNGWRLILLEKMLRFRMEMETRMEDTAAITKMIDSLCTKWCYHLPSGQLECPHYLKTIFFMGWFFLSMYWIINLCSK